MTMSFSMFSGSILDICQIVTADVIETLGHSQFLYNLCYYFRLGPIKHLTPICVLIIDYYGHYIAEYSSYPLHG